MKRTVLAMWIAMSLAGCAELEALRSGNAASPVSFVAELSDADSERIGKDMTTFLADQLPAAKTTVYVPPSNTIVRAVLVDEMAERVSAFLKQSPVKGQPWCCNTLLPISAMEYWFGCDMEMQSPAGTMAGRPMEACTQPGR